MKVNKIVMLKLTAIMIGICTLVICVFCLPKFMEVYVRSNPSFELLSKQVFMGIYLTLIPFMFSLYQAIEILIYIEEKSAFSNKVVHALKYIKYSASLIAVTYTLLLIRLALISTSESSILIIFGVMGFTSVVVAMFASVLQELMQSALEIKSENDLTV